jgi:EAL domain-containing protein (putative c-di-GMP-specific phosphodiesterase class I)
LIEAPAHYLKFDISLVGNIDKAQDAKRNIVKMLVNMSKDMGISTLAEGLDRVEEVQVCQDLGFDYIQGFYFGRPKERIN